MSELSEEVGRTIASEADYVETEIPRPRSRKKRGSKAPPEPFVYQENEASIKTCVILSEVVLRVLCRVAKWEQITDDEALEVGRALDRVLQKRMPLMSQWGEEIALGMVLVGVILPRVMGGAEETQYIVDPDKAVEAVAEKVSTPEPKPASDKDW